MKPKNYPFLRSALLTAALLGLASASGQADVLLTDNFDTAQDGANFNDQPGLSNDQGGTLDPTTSTISYVGTRPWTIRRGFTDGGSYVSEMAVIGNGTPYSDPDPNGFNTYSSLDHNFATDANTAGAPLEIKFNIKVIASVAVDGSDWGAIQIGSSQNAWIQNTSNNFASLFRDNGVTQQFKAGAAVSSAITFADGDLITLTLSNAAGTGSAFNSDGATDVAKIYVNNTLVGTWTDLDLGSGDGYLTFAAHSANLAVDNLAINLVTAASDYNTWGAPYSLSTGSEGLDLDGDGVKNQAEYAFGLIPNSGASVNPITTQLNKGTGQFSYQRRDNGLTGLTYTIWYSTDLATWTQDTGASQPDGTPDGNGVETITATLSALPGSPLPAKLFIQVRAD